jgi:hypothetical protein
MPHTRRWKTASMSTFPAIPAPIRPEASLRLGGSSTSRPTAPTSTSKIGWPKRPWLGWSSRSRRIARSICNTGSSRCTTRSMPNPNWSKNTAARRTATTRSRRLMRRWSRAWMTPSARWSRRSSGSASPTGPPSSSPPTTAATVTTASSKRTSTASNTRSTPRTTRRCAAAKPQYGKAASACPRRFIGRG